MGVVEYILAFLVSTVKFLFAPWSMVVISKAGFWETIVTTSSGAATGLIVFFFAGEIIFEFFEKSGRKKKKKVFTPMRRRIVKMKTKYGILSLCVIGVIISIPVTALLAAKYFSNWKTTLPILILAFTCWSFILTSIAFIFR